MSAKYLILVIDDTAMLRRAIVRGLSKRIPNNWGIIQAGNIDEARKQITDHAETIRIITFDYQVPGADGTTTPLLLEVIENDAVQAVLVAASSLYQNSAKLMKAGAHTSCPPKYLPETIPQVIAVFQKRGLYRTMSGETIPLDHPTP